MTSLLLSIDIGLAWPLFGVTGCYAWWLMFQSDPHPCPTWGHVGCWIFLGMLGGVAIWVGLLLVLVVALCISLGEEIAKLPIWKQPVCRPRRGKG